MLKSWAAPVRGMPPSFLLSKESFLINQTCGSVFAERRLGGVFAGDAPGRISNAKARA